MELVEKINRSGDLVNKFCRDGIVVNKAYRDGDLVYQRIRENQEEPTPIGNCIRIELLDNSSGFVRCQVIEGSGSGYTLDDLNLQYSYDRYDWFKWDYYSNVGIRLNDTVYIRGFNPEHFSKNYTTYFKFVFDKDVKVSGNIMGLINYNNPPLTIPNTDCFKELFGGCTHLMDVSNLVLPATTLANGCYQSMFDGCTGLTTAPSLPATTLAEGCYANMFRYCSSLNYIKCLATDISASNCTYNWTNNVSYTGTFVKSASMADWNTGVNGIPTGWTVEDA